MINLTGVKLPERNRGAADADAGGFDFIVGNGERGGGVCSNRRKYRKEGRENDFLFSLPYTLPVASKRENVISIRHTCHEKVEGGERAI